MVLLWSQREDFLMKKLIVSFTTGSPVDTYKKGGIQNFTLDTLTKGFHQFAGGWQY